MSYKKRSPCQKYFDKSTSKEEIRKSYSSTKFVPFRRPSDTTSDSGSDDFKMELAEDISSSFSRSSSDSYTFSGNTRYQCILKDLTEITHLDEEFDSNVMKQNETLDDFRSRLNSRRKVKTRYQDSQDDDKTDNSCDSTTTKAHEEILRNANLLKQEQMMANNDGGFNVKKYHREIHYKTANNNKINRNDLEENDETILLNEFDAILNMEENKLNDFNDDVFHQPVSSVSINNASNTKTIARSSTENFLAKNSDDNKQKSAASPRFRRKTHVLKAASSIPSLIFSNKSFKPKPTPASNNNFEYGQTPSIKFDHVMKKNSIDEDVFNISVTKARRSPLRLLGNLVDDKIFRGRWSTAKRAKSTDEITWALANEDNELRTRAGSQKQNRKKSFGGLLTTNNIDTNNNLFNNNNNNNNKKQPQYKNTWDKFKNSFDLTNEYTNYNTNTNSNNNNNKFTERKISNNYAEVSSLSSMKTGVGTNNPNNHHQYNVPIRQLKSKNEINAETLAEIEAFEKMLETQLQD